MSETEIVASKTRFGQIIEMLKRSGWLVPSALNRPTPFRVSYHGDSTIILDARGEWITGQVPREMAEEIARVFTKYVVNSSVNKIPL